MIGKTYEKLAMKLEIENWLAKRHSSVNVIKLFNEAVICYRNTAYRASLLFSYLGFLTIVKEILIQSRKPIEIPDGEWSNILRDINNDEKWEKAVYESLIRRNRPIF